MIDFKYAAPTHLEDAIRQLSRDGAKVLAGGTDILVQLREGQRTAALMVDVKKIPEMNRMDYSVENGLRLGASVPCWRITDSQEIAAAVPALTDSAKIIGGWQIQSRASIGGNLCNSSPAADCIPSLIVHSAVCHIAGPSGRHSLPAVQFCTGPGRNQLQQGQLLVSLQMPSRLSGSGSAYERFIPRNEMDIAVVGAASWVQLDHSRKKILNAKIALGAAAPTPVFAQEASEWLAGKTVSEEVFAQAGELAKRAASPISDMRGTAEYRTHLVGVLTRRTLATACQRACG